MNPQPSPTTTPHSKTSCQASRISGDSATAAPVAAIARHIVSRTPTRSMIAAANGPIAP